MPASTTQPIRPTRIEPRPEVAAYYDTASRLTERFALLVALLTVLYFAAHFIAAGLHRAGWL